MREKRERERMAWAISWIANTCGHLKRHLKPEQILNGTKTTKTKDTRSAAARKAELAALKDKFKEADHGTE